jgi:hypothetical protein
MNYPQYQVIQGVYIPTSASFCAIQSLASPGAQWAFPNPSAFKTLVTSLSLLATANTEAGGIYPFVYLVGSPWATITSAQTAATADYATITSARNTAAMTAALLQTVPNAYVSIASNSPIAGPG